MKLARTEESRSISTSAASAAAPAPTQNMPTREELTTYMPLVHQVVARSLRKLPPNVLRDDLQAAATFGLMDALRKSVDRGPAFEWYARIRIRGAVLDELRAQDWLTRRTRNRMALAQSRGEPSGLAVVGFDDLPEPHAAGFADESEPSPLAHFERSCERAALKTAVAQLPEREASIVTWHYFEGIAFKDIAARLNVSEPRISQLHSRAMGRLRLAMTDTASAEAAA